MPRRSDVVWRPTESSLAPVPSPSWVRQVREGIDLRSRRPGPERAGPSAGDRTGGTSRSTRRCFAASSSSSTTRGCARCGDDPRTGLPDREVGFDCIPGRRPCSRGTGSFPSPPETWEAAAHVTGVQPNHRGHDGRDGALRDRSGDPVGRGTTSTTGSSPPVQYARYEALAQRKYPQVATSPLAPR